MESAEELRGLRTRLQDQLDSHQREARRITDALKALETVESLLREDPKQTTLPQVNPYESLGGTDLVLRIVSSSSRPWTMSDIMEAAKAGGKNLEQWSNPYNILYVAATRLVKKGKIRKDVGTEPGSPDGAVTYTRVMDEPGD